MASEGQWPKVAGDPGYASEANKMFYGTYGQGTFGDGTDGALSVPSGTTTVATSVKQYTSITVSAGATLAFSGVGKYLIFVQGDMTVDGTIQLGNRAGTAPTDYDAGAIVAATAPTAGVGGAALKTLVLWAQRFQRPLVEATDGGVGATSDNVGGSGGGGGGGGGSYGAGGSGGNGASGSGGGSARTGGALGEGKATVYFFVGGNLSFGAASAIDGDGADGGSSTTYANDPTGGGGGGGAGGNVYIFTKGNCTLTAGCAIDLTGGIGGNSGASTNKEAGGGGGGGGGGSLFLLCGGTLANAATITTTGGAAGTAGSSGEGTPQNGNAGSNGTSQVIALQYTIT